MKYWRIVAGHMRKNESDSVKSMMLGDWLRRGYVAIGHGRTHPLTKKFYRMRENDKVVVTTNGFVWALGTIVGNVKHPKPTWYQRYPFTRKVIWSKVTRVSYKSLPETLRNKLGYRPAMVELDPPDWETLRMSVSG